MQNSLLARLGVGVVLAALVVLGVLYLRPPVAQAPGAHGSDTASTTTIDLGNGVQIQTTGKVTVQESPTGASSVPPPSYNRPLTFSNNLSPEAVSILRAKEQDLIAQLKTNPRQLDAWLVLGTYRKMAGDYQGAAEAWQYVATAGGSGISYIAYGNLGDLYMNFLKDPARAEANYKAAIAAKPTYIDFYRALYTYYHFSLMDDAKAAAILDLGLKNNPDNPDLMALKDSLKK